MSGKEKLSGHLGRNIIQLVSIYQGIYCTLIKTHQHNEQIKKYRVNLGQRYNEKTLKQQDSFQSRKLSVV